MGEDGTNEGTQGWSPGGIPVSEMDATAVDSKIREIENDQNFMGEGKMLPSVRKQMLEQRDELYNHESRANPEGDAALEAGHGDMHQTLEAQDITEESLAEDKEKFATRDWEAEMSRGREEIEKMFGGKDEAEKHLQAARGILDRFGQDEDRDFVANSGLGNNADFISLLSKLDAMLQTAREKENRK